MTGWDVVQPVLALGLSVSSLVIAGMAFRESARNGEAQREHNRLSVRPAVHSWLHHDADRGTLVFYIENNGLGPAEIECVRFFDRNNPSFECDSSSKPAVISLVQRVLGDNDFRVDHLGINVTSLAKGYTLRVGEKRGLLELTFKEMSEASRADEALGGLLGCKVEYSSLYGDVVNVVDP